jgi:hypothetical protein
VLQHQLESILLFLVQEAQEDLESTLGQDDDHNFIAYYYFCLPFIS